MKDNYRLKTFVTFLLALILGILILVIVKEKMDITKAKKIYQDGLEKTFEKATNYDSVCEEKRCKNCGHPSHDGLCPSCCCTICEEE